MATIRAAAHCRIVRAIMARLHSKMIIRVRADLLNLHQSSHAH